MKLKTKADYRKLIKIIEKATKHKEHGEHFASLISAMRGPDSGDSVTKHNTTIPIRSMVQWEVGIMGIKGQGNVQQVKDWMSEADVVRNNGYHFYSHINRALVALDYFGIPSKKRK